LPFSGPEPVPRDEPRPFHLGKCQGSCPRGRALL
jgi:hypothetical protein